MARHEDTDGRCGDLFGEDGPTVSDHGRPTEGHSDAVEWLYEKYVPRLRALTHQPQPQSGGSNPQQHASHSATHEVDEFGRQRVDEQLCED